MKRWGLGGGLFNDIQQDLIRFDEILEKMNKKLMTRFETIRFYQKWCDLTRNEKIWWDLTRNDQKWRGEWMESSSGKRGDLYGTEC